MEITTLGGGCFWCMEAVFSNLKGVVKVEPGYSGGWLEKPTYEQVSSGKTGHAEVVQITFDPRILSFKEILEIFFATHDPTTLNRQGADVGSQYRSIILYHNSQQKEISEKIIRELNDLKKFDVPIVTQVEPFKKFYIAEDYHKNYYDKHPEQTYCRLVIDPKISKLFEKFSDKLK